MPEEQAPMGGMDLQQLQAAMEQRQLEVQAQRQKLQSEAVEKLKELTEKDDDVDKLSQLMLFGHRLVNWAAAEASENPEMTALMIGMLNEFQQRAAAKQFDFSAVMKEFNTGLHKYMMDLAEVDKARNKDRDKILGLLTKHVKQKTVPLPLGLERKFENGMAHGDVLPIFGRQIGISLIAGLISKEYKKLGGRVVLFAKPDTKLKDVATDVFDPIGWRGRGDTIGQLRQCLNAVFTGTFRPAGLLIVEDLDGFIDETFMESRPARLVRSLAVLQQLQSMYPLGAVVCINTENDKPDGMRPQEVYPPYLTDRPHIWADCKQSELAGGSLNVQIDTDIYTVPQLQKMLVTDE